MCGIFGGFTLNGNALSLKMSKKVKKLANLSERRGSDASGIYFANSYSGKVIKFNGGIGRLLKTKDIKEIDLYPLEIIAGHTRLSTHGEIERSENNQPAMSENWVIFHNGIILNHLTYISQTGINLPGGLDTYALNSILETSNSISESENQLNELGGEVTFVAIGKSGQILAYTNVGNLYISKSHDEVFFASEEIFLAKCGLKNIKQITHGTLMELSPKKLKPIDFYLTVLEYEGESIRLPSSNYSINKADQLQEIAGNILRSQRTLERCTQCLLPKNFPGIEFNAYGICTLCLSWRTPVLLGQEKLLEEIRGQKVLLNLSGGRDSSYAQAKLFELDINTTVFTYDWGFISTAARENMAKLCGLFQHEHVLVSPDLRKNRKIVASVLECWFKNPDLGVIPLLMAGDKPFHSMSMRIAKERGGLKIIQADHYLETTGFKSMLAGAKVDFSKGAGGVNYRLNYSSVFKMGINYLRFVLKIKTNRIAVFLQMLNSFFVYYQLQHNFIRIFDYIPWNEKEIDSVLDDLGWKSNKRDHAAKWRMGDSTAPMYNSLYLLNLGYTENDAMLSNQIRAGLISRVDAEKNLEKLNKIDTEGILEYLEIIGVNHDLYFNYLKSLVRN